MEGVLIIYGKGNWKHKSLFLEKQMKLYIKLNRHETCLKDAILKHKKPESAHIRTK